MKSFINASEILVGVVGYGGAFNMGKSHLDLMRKAGMTPAAVAEIDPARRRVAEADFPGIATFDSVDSMLSGCKVDLVSIITPHDTHAPLAIQCLKAGRHVVCEKPLALTTREADAMIAAARNNDVLLSAFHNRHWDSNILEAVKRIRDKGEIGEVVRVDAHMCHYQRPGKWWRSSKSLSGGILYDWGVHLIEYALQLIDSRLVEVSGFSHEGFWVPKTAWKEDSNEDEAFAVARFQSGQWMTLHFSSIDSQGYPEQLRVTGTRGSYSMNLQRTWIHKPLANGKTIREFANPPSNYEPFYQNIARCLTGHEELVITAEWARRPIHIIDLAMQSARKGRSLPAKYP